MPTREDDSGANCAIQVCHARDPPTPQEHPPRVSGYETRALPLARVSVFKFLHLDAAYLLKTPKESAMIYRFFVSAPSWPLRQSYRVQKRAPARRCVLAEGRVGCQSTRGVATFRRVPSMRNLYPMT